jgi:hypothetical protein
MLLLELLEQSRAWFSKQAETAAATVKHHSCLSLLLLQSASWLSAAGTCVVYCFVRAFLFSSVVQYKKLIKQQNLHYQVSTSMQIEGKRTLGTLNRAMTIKPEGHDLNITVTIMKI